jgi:hypothetical protein
MSVDLSAGAQRFVAGTGLLLGDGAPEGSIRGAVSFGPYQAWQNTVIGRVKYGSTEFSAFYLDANEIYTPETDSQIVGAEINRTIRPNEFFGVYGGTVINSNAPYPKALPDLSGSILIPDARDGLKFLNGYFRWNPLNATRPDFWISGDIAAEWNERINMRAWGARFAIGNRFVDLPLAPTISYNYHTVSGDDAGTPALEKFDPLFGGLSGDYWTVGANSAMILGNSNLNVHRFAIATDLSDREQLAAKYFIISMNERNSPMSLENRPGFPELLTGGSRRLADEVAIEYTRLMNENSVLNLALNYSMPKTALDDFAGQLVDNWFGVAVGLNMRF